MEPTDNSRRNFIKQNSLASLGLLTGSATDNYNGLRTTGKSSIEFIGKISLKQLRDNYNSYLFKQFLPNMDRLVIDHKYGGFMCNADIKSGKLLSTNKQTWFEGRGIWIYSFLYNHFDKDPRFLEVARKSKDFIMKQKPTDDSFWISMFNQEGNPISGGGNQYGNQFAVPTSAQGDIYGNLFIAEGLLEYAKASGEEQYYSIAKKIILDAVARYDQPDYIYHVNYLNPELKNAPGSRVLGHWMILLRTATQILENNHDTEINSLAERCIDAIMNHHLNPGYQLFNEVLNHDFSRPKNEFSNFCYTGHGIETLWMVMAEAARRKDIPLFKRASEAFKRHVTVAHDDVYGGYFRSLDHVKNNRWKVDKVLWLHEEILIGTLFLMEHTGDLWAKQQFEETYDYIQDKFIRPDYLFWIPGGDRRLIEHHKGRVEHYHHPRHLMLNLLALNRMIARDGKPSGIFDS